MELYSKLWSTKKQFFDFSKDYWKKSTKLNVRKSISWPNLNRILIIERKISISEIEATICCKIFIFNFLFNGYLACPTICKLQIIKDTKKISNSPCWYGFLFSKYKEGILKNGSELEFKEDQPLFEKLFTRVIIDLLIPNIE